MTATTPLPTAALGRVPGSPESALSSDLAQRLPESSPPPPWESTMAGVQWFQRARPGAAAALPRQLRGRLRPRWVVGALLAYHDTPVGAYREVFGVLAERRGLRLTLHVPFMAVDSVASIRAGRAIWALPKTAAELTGRADAAGQLTAAGDGWWITADVRPLGPSLPMVVPIEGEQVWPDGTIGRFGATLRGRLRPVLVSVEVAAGSSLAGWLRPGRHFGVQWSSTRFSIEAPQVVEA